jgi:hypothetical protein
MVGAVFGFLGGVVSNLFTARTVAAQQDSRVIRAQSFQVVNKDGIRVAELGLAEEGRFGQLRLQNGTFSSHFNASQLVFRYGDTDPYSDVNWRVGVGIFGDRDVGAIVPQVWIRDAKGNQIWKAR